MIDSLGGYRILRCVGTGSRAEVFLAHPVVPEADPTPVVMKLYGASVSDESIVAEIEALSRAAGPHVVRVVDVLSTPEGAPALILTRHSTGSLARLVDDRARLEPGEAITILAPLALALGRMHAAGVAHGAIGPGAVLFGAAGSPTLACFGRSTIFTPQLSLARLELEQSVLDDVLAFGSLAASVLTLAGAESLAHEARTQAAPGPWLASFVDALFDSAEPAPVALARRAEVEPVPFPARAIAPRAPLDVEQPSAVPTWRAFPVNARESLRAVRRPVWIAAAAAVVAFVLAFVALPREDSASPPHPSSSPTRPAVSSGSGPVFRDDPVAAALVLLEARELCIRELSIECLDAVDQAGSSAWEADRAVVRSVLDGAEVQAVPHPTAAHLIQRLGDSALVSLGPETQPTSVLVVKSEAGWRIRDCLDG